VFTLVQSHTHVDTVQTVLCGFINWSDIYWSHTMKALGSLVTFVRRNLATVVTLRYTYSDMKVWSRMFAVNVQTGSIQHTDWNTISWYTRASNLLPVVFVLKVSDINIPFWDTLRDVLLSSVLATFNVYVTVSVYFSFHFCASLAVVRGICCDRQCRDIVYLRQRWRNMFLPVFVCLSVCLLARLLKNACSDLDEMCVDRCRDIMGMDELINFWARSGS